MTNKDKKTWGSPLVLTALLSGSILLGCDALPNQGPLTSGDVSNPLSPTSKGEQLSPTSKGEQLTPTSKGEFKFTSVKGELTFPVSGQIQEADIQFLVDGQPLADKNVKIVSISSDKLTFSLAQIPVDKNVVLEIKTPQFQLGIMVPDVSSTEFKSLNVKSSVVLAVVQQAEKQGIRKIKDWKLSEVQVLLGLPELQTATEEVQSLYSKDPSPALISSESAQATVQKVLDAFVANLKN